MNGDTVSVFIGFENMFKIAASYSMNISFVVPIQDVRQQAQRLRFILTG